MPATKNQPKSRVGHAVAMRRSASKTGKAVATFGPPRRRASKRFAS